MSLASSFDLGPALSRSAGLCSSSHQTQAHSTCTRDAGHLWLAVWRVRHLGLVLHLVEALAAIYFLAVNAGQRLIDHLATFTCLTRIARLCESRAPFASSVDNSFCDVKSRLFQRHVVERFLVRDIADCGDVVCVPVVVSRGCPETLLFRSSMYTRILN